jgi:hypothetical protein
VKLFYVNLFIRIYLSFTNFRDSIRKKIHIFSSLAINKRKISLYYMKYIVIKRNNQLNLAKKLKAFNSKIQNQKKVAIFSQNCIKVWKWINRRSKVWNYSMSTFLLEYIWILQISAILFGRKYIYFQVLLSIKGR